MRLIKKAQKLKGVGWAAAEGRRIILDKYRTLIKTEAFKRQKKLGVRGYNLKDSTSSRIFLSMVSNDVRFWARG